MLLNDLNFHVDIIDPREERKKIMGIALYWRSTSREFVFYIQYNKFLKKKRIVLHTSCVYSAFVLHL